MEIDKIKNLIIRNLDLRINNEISEQKYLSNDKKLNKLLEQTKKQIDKKDNIAYRYRYKKYLIGREKYLTDLIINSNNPEFYDGDKVSIIKDKLELIRATLKELE